VRGDLLDLILLGAAALFALSGYRQGFVVGVLSFVGFLGGGVIGANLAPTVAKHPPFDGLPRTTVALLTVFLAATLGQVLTTLVGHLVRNKILWKPARTVDAVAGAGVSVVSFLLVAWLVGTAVSSAPSTKLTSQVRRSAVLAYVDKAVPGGAKSLVAGLRRLIDKGDFPSVFGDLVPTRVRPVDPPDAALAQSEVVTTSRSRIFKITGVANSCSKRIEGTGFLYAQDRVMTNAHVVAGVSKPDVEIGGVQHHATVVLYDPDRDIAVLAVPGLKLTPLPFVGPAKSGESAIVVGYPEDGPYRADAARVRGTQPAQGPNIYQNKTVVRQIYALRTRVRPGNSGGPLLAPKGGVYGVIFARAEDDPETGYALTAKEVASDADAGRTLTSQVSTRGCD
jgi:S1-C subfamily serine protease